MIALADQQLNAATRAAALLPPSHRDHFMRSVANRLTDLANGDLGAAITFVLSSYGVAAGLRASDRRSIGEHHAKNSIYRRR